MILASLIIMHVDYFLARSLFLTVTLRTPNKEAIVTDTGLVLERLDVRFDDWFDLFNLPFT